MIQKFTIDISVYDIIFSIAVMFCFMSSITHLSKIESLLAKIEKILQRFK